MENQNVVMTDDQLEDSYRITTCIRNAHVLVENLDVPDSCAINIHRLTDDEQRIKKAFDEKDWVTFICELIEHGYLQ